MATKRLKLKVKVKLSGVLPSLQICRSKNPLSDAIPPTPSNIYRLSPFNTKSGDINYPTHRSNNSININDHDNNCSNRFPAPPPSTPLRCRCSKRQAVGCRCGSRPSLRHLMDRSGNSPNFVSRESFFPWKNRTSKSDLSRTETTSLSCQGGSSSGDDDMSGVDKDSEDAQLFSSNGFSFDSSYEFNYPETIDKKDPKRDNNDNSKKVVRHRRHVSRSWSRRYSRTGPFRAKESVAVVKKKSEDPYEDFKRSMLEMILEKQMFLAEDLEQLLQCFLSLNSCHHHGAIIQAFTEIWEILFCDSSVH